MATRITPPMNAKGLFLLAAPFVAKEDVTYMVSAIRTFEEIRADKEEPLDLVYRPVGLGETEYQADIAAGAQIIALLSSTEKPIYVPDTYILSYPNMGVVPYSWLVLSCSLGPLPDSYDPSVAIQTIQQELSDHTGVQDITVNVGRATYTDTITDDMHVQLTIARQAAITNNDTYLARALRAEALTQSQAEYIAQLEDIIKGYTESQAQPT